MSPFDKMIAEIPTAYSHGGVRLIGRRYNGCYVVESDFTEFHVWDNGGEVGVQKINDEGLPRMFPYESVALGSVATPTLLYRLERCLNGEEIDFDLEPETYSLVGPGLSQVDVAARAAARATEVLNRSEALSNLANMVARDMATGADNLTERPMVAVTNFADARGAVESMRAQLEAVEGAVAWLETSMKAVHSV